MPGCNYSAPNGFFKWPKKEFLKKKWEKICGLENVSENAKVCIPHFHPDHLIQRSQNTSNPRLKLGAVPMLNLPKVLLVNCAQFLKEIRWIFTLLLTFHRSFSSK